MSRDQPPPAVRLETEIVLEVIAGGKRVVLPQPPNDVPPGGACIGLCTAGAGELCTATDWRSVSAGTAIIFGSDVTSGLNLQDGGLGFVARLGEDATEWLICRHPALRWLLVKEPGPRLIDMDQRKKITAAFVDLSTELHSDDQGRSTAIELQVVSILLELLRSRPGQKASPANKADLVRRFSRIVEEHFREQPSVTEIARALDVTEAQLRSALKSGGYDKPLKILHDRLLKEAKHCLAKTKVSITSISEELGFATAANFSRFFSDRAGCPPSAYRRYPAFFDDL